MPVLCPNPHCNHTRPIASFGLHHRDEEIYQCAVCGRRFAVTEAAPPPTCCAQPVRRIGQRTLDLARCPKCREVSIVVGASLTGSVGV